MATPLVRRLGRVDYQPTWQAMQRFTDARHAGTRDELWLLEHPPVFTLGQSARAEHVLAPGAIPVIPVDRGGQVTYHGPGQSIVYLLLDLRRRGLGVRRLVTMLEQAVVAVLAASGIAGEPRADAPGVYVDGAKVAALGLRVRRGCSFHGVALNVAMDLEPFARINPCGYAGLTVTDMRSLGADTNSSSAGEALIARLSELLADAARGRGSDSPVGQAPTDRSRGRGPDSPARQAPTDRSRGRGSDSPAGRAPTETSASFP